jgi:hypothetical protein
MWRERGARSQLIRQRFCLFEGRDLRREQQPDQSFGQWLTLTSRSFESWEFGLQLRNGVTSKADALLRIKKRSLVVDAFDISASFDALCNGHLTKSSVAIIFFQLF